MPILYISYVKNNGVQIILTNEYFTKNSDKRLKNYFLSEIYNSTRFIGTRQKKYIILSENEPIIMNPVTTYGRMFQSISIM